MTVCIAVICERGRIIGVSDRMLTSGDVEFEPPQAKVWGLTNSIQVLIAGDAAIQAEVLGPIQTIVENRVAVDVSNWWKVRHIAEMYQDEVLKATAKRAEAAILAPMGLTLETFVEKQNIMNPDLVMTTARQLQDYALPPIEAIFVGVDLDGPVVKNKPGIYSHIYVANGAEITCRDSIGFAAIGVGRFHAESQLMFAKHVRARPFPESLLLAYSAKKHAEVAPGVGAETDMFSIGPQPGSYFSFAPHVIEGLERIYRDSQRKIAVITRASEQESRGFIDEINRGSRSGAQQSPKAEELKAPELPIHDQTNQPPSQE